VGKKVDIPRHSGSDPRGRKGIQNIEGGGKKDVLFSEKEGGRREERWGKFFFRRGGVTGKGKRRKHPDSVPLVGLGGKKHREVFFHL